MHESLSRSVAGLFSISPAHPAGRDRDPVRYKQSLFSSLYLKRAILVFCLAMLMAPLAWAQQTGTVMGRVTATNGDPLPGVTVEASSPVLPQPRITSTDGNGDFRMPALQPGTYTLQFTLAGMQTQTRTTNVYLAQTTTVNAVQMGVEALQESITVTAQNTFVDPTTTALKTSVDSQMIREVPVGQEYRDLLKLAPAVQYTEAEVRGPSAGGSEQDNVYLFDGVNVTLPLFGTLAADPSTHDIEQVTFLKGGAKALDFNRSAGFTIDSVSKSGTSQFKGEVQYQIQNHSLISDVDGATAKTFDQNKAWATLSLGGPILRDHLYFYGSYYRPTITRSNSANVYGNVPDFKSTRDEGFGKLTFTPTGNILLNASYRDSSRTDDNSSIGGFEAPSVALNETSDEKIGIFEGSWVVNSRSYVTGKYNDYRLLGSSLPGNLLSVVPSGAPGTRLDLNSLDTQGYFEVPSLIAGNDAFNSFIQPFIDKYGFIRNGARTGGGSVGGGVQINDQDFFRKSGQLGYDLTLGTSITHNLHAGFQAYTDEEDLARGSNGFGDITVPGGRATCPKDSNCAGQPVFFQADFQRSNTGTDARQVIRSEFQSNNIELNDTILWNNWSFNLGVMASDDTLYGQGLREDSSTLSGFVSAPGHKYKMHEVKYSDQIQPRLGATWAYNGTDTVYASYAKYNAAASSLPRAASWDRNTLGLVTRAFFDASGVLIGSQQLSSSSGKLFEDGIKPRYTDEYLIGTSQQFSGRWTARAYARYRYSAHFWEDTNNNARVAFNPPEGIPRELYIPDLAARTGQIGSGSSYVIAQLDGAFTKYYEATFESDMRATDNLNFKGTYTWSHYYGNFDQDSTSTTYDFATFIGSSNLADGAGRQVWDNKYGDLHGDRRHLLKVYGTYTLPWNASAGAFALYQSGHAWEAWSYVPYSSLTSSTSDTNRYAEPAGSRRTDPHYQVDLNYTQNIPLGSTNFQLIADVYNLFNKQTGYAPYPAVHSSLFGTPRLQYAPRRIQLAARLQF